MDAVESPRIVFDGAAECADRDRAEQSLRQALAQTPGKGWVVTVRMTRTAALPAVNAEGEITDETGAPRGRQVTSGTAADCASLAGAVGAWASGVLAARSQDAGAPDSAPSGSELPPLPALPAPAPSLPPPAPPPASTAVPVTSGPLPAPPPATSVPMPWPAPAPSAPVPAHVVRPAPGVSDPEGPTSGPALRPGRDESAPLELGVGTFMMAGGGSGGYVGVTPFLIDDVGEAVFLRPSVALGGSIATNVPSTWAAARIDTCMRFPERYATRGGLQLDLCGGAEVGFSYVASGILPGNPASGQTLPFVELGPGVDLRAEVGKVAVTLRGVGGIDVAKGGYTDVTGMRIDEPLWSWRIEVDLAVVLYNERTQLLRVGANSLDPK
jgi:hypothetical protein